MNGPAMPKIWVPHRRPCDKRCGTLLASWQSNERRRHDKKTGCRSDGLMINDAGCGRPANNLINGPVAKKAGWRGDGLVINDTGHCRPTSNLVNGPATTKIQLSRGCPRDRRTLHRKANITKRRGELMTCATYLPLPALRGERVDGFVAT